MSVWINVNDIFYCCWYCEMVTFPINAAPSESNIMEEILQDLLYLQYLLYFSTILCSHSTEL